MKWTAETLKEKVWSIVEAEKRGQNLLIFEIPQGAYCFTDYGYYGARDGKQPVQKHTFDSDTKIRIGAFTEKGIAGYTSCELREFGAKRDPNGWNRAYYRYIRLDWQHIIEQPKVLKPLVAWIEKVTPHYSANKEKGIITFENEKTKEKLYCDLANQKFVRTYKKGKDRQVRYPAQFFKYVSGRALIKTLSDPKAATFNKLVDLVAQQYSNCRNFGTFLVKMFDHQHLEQYISAGVEFSFDMPFNYTDFSKDIRNKLNEHKIKYTQDIGALFCSDQDTGRAVFAQIKDCKGFAAMTRVLVQNIQALNTLVNHYHYDLKRLFEYCRERNWQAHQRGPRDASPENIILGDGQYFYPYAYDIVSTLRDYARMALDVYGEVYEKYPDNIQEAHAEANRIYNTRKREIDNKRFEELVDKSLEWKNKEFVVVYPKTADEVIEEGKRLRHCVGSYIQSVVRGECKIVFLRLKEEKEKPFVTIEIQGGNIRQARAVGNSNPTYDARMALRDYAKEKNLLYRG